jgi:hypothetical protein
MNPPKNKKLVTIFENRIIILAVSMLLNKGL